MANNLLIYINWKQIHNSLNVLFICNGLKRRIVSQTIVAFEKKLWSYVEVAKYSPKLVVTLQSKTVSRITFHATLRAASVSLGKQESYFQVLQCLTYLIPDI